MKNRLEKIDKAVVNPLQKARLVKGRIVSVWNYTAAVQEIDKEFAVYWDLKIYSAITRSKFGATSRKDLLYEPILKGGMGMVSLEDVYKINRCRILAQIMEAAQRQTGRNQVPWVEKW